MWDWITFGICVGSVVPSVFLVGFLLRYLLRNSERRHCFKDASEDCEILVSTSVSRPRITHEVLHEYTHRQVGGGGSSSHSNLQLSETPPPEYSAATAPYTTAAADSQFIASDPLERPPVYGSSSTQSISSISSIYDRLPSRPLNLNVLITSLDLLPEFAALPPPPSYDESVREEHVRC